ncbi:MAG: hypothetical protein SFU25_09600, partial [Candidatus Caenarcaniphilales bacterium]|nr:hypothetical protein [Candidatus Caenarcaniphilales bacterium]
MGIGERITREMGFIKHLQQKTVILGIYLSFVSFAISFFSHTADEILYGLALACSLIAGRFFNKNLKFLNLAWLFYFIVLFSSQIINGTLESKIFFKQLLEVTIWFVFSGLFEQASGKQLRKGFYILYVFSCLFSFVV